MISSGSCVIVDPAAGSDPINTVWAFASGAVKSKELKTDVISSSFLITSLVFAERYIEYLFDCTVNRGG